MFRRLKRKRRSARTPGESASQTAVPETRQTTSVQNDPPPSVEPAARWLLVSAVTLTVVWLSGLSVLARRTANPLTLNWRQIVESQHVVLASVRDARGGEIDIERQWKDPSLPSPVVVAHLSEAGAADGQRYLIPLTGVRSDRLTFTVTPLASGRPVVYPPTEEAIEQLARILAEAPSPDGS